jgi:hypothetical protein
VGDHPPAGSPVDELDEVGVRALLAGDEQAPIQRCLFARLLLVTLCPCTCRPCGARRATGGGSAGPRARLAAARSRRSAHAARAGAGRRSPAESGTGGQTPPPRRHRLRFCTLMTYGLPSGEYFLPGHATTWRTQTCWVGGSATASTGLMSIQPLILATSRMARSTPRWREWWSERSPPAPARLPAAHVLRTDLAQLQVARHVQDLKPRRELVLRSLALGLAGAVAKVPADVLPGVARCVRVGWQVMAKHKLAERHPRGAGMTEAHALDPVHLRAGGLVGLQPGGVGRQGRPPLPVRRGIAGHETGVALFDRDAAPARHPGPRPGRSER